MSELELQKELQHEADQVCDMNMFKGHFTLKVNEPEADSADRTVTVQRATGQVYRFTWTFFASEKRRRRQLELFLLSALRNDLPSGNYNGKDYK